MKITFFVPTVSMNGGHRVVAIYAEKLMALGHDVKVIAFQQEEESGLRKLKRLATGRAVEKPGGKAYYDALGACLIEIPKRLTIDPNDVPDADVVIATWWRTAFSVASLPPEKGKKAYFVQHHEVHPHLPWDLSRGSYYLPLRKITIADWLVETMAEVYGDTDVVKIENSVDTALFHAPPRARNTTPRVGLLYAGTPFKGVDISLRAFEIAKEKYPDLQLLAFGAHDPSPDLPLPDGTEFHKLPKQDTLRDLYAKCDVWMCGSRAEGFHLPPLEAMACRCPVVSTRIGGAVEIVTEGKNGYIVDVDDAEALGARLIDVLDRSPEAWQQMSDAALARAQSYTWDDATRLFETTLERMIATPA